MKTSFTKLSSVYLATLAAALAPFGVQAATQYVILDPNITWNGFETVCTHGYGPYGGGFYRHHMYRDFDRPYHRDWGWYR